MPSSTRRSWNRARSVRRARATPGAGGSLGEGAGVDRDRVHADVDDPAVGQQQTVVAPPRGVAGEQRRSREVVAEARRLEADVRRAEQSVDDLLAPRQASPDLGRRKRHVQEEGDAGIGLVGAQHPRHEHQVVVVHPQQRVLVGELVRPVGEPLVDGAVDGPVAVVERVVLDQPVQQRPQRPVREAVVVTLDLAARQMHALAGRRAGCRPSRPARRGRRPSRARCRASGRRARARARRRARRSPARSDRWRPG